MTLVALVSDVVFVVRVVAVVSVVFKVVSVSVFLQFMVSCFNSSGGSFGFSSRDRLDFCSASGSGLDSDRDTGFSASVTLFAEISF